jgi:hypothetical protein
MIGRQLRALLFGFAGFTLALSFAQAPTGTVAGVVTDASGAVVANAPVTITNKDTGTTRSLLSGPDGAFSAPSLPAGSYIVKVAMTGFSTLVREATVETGATTTVDLKLQVGTTRDVVTVEAATTQMEYEHHAIEGVITRDKVEDLPLNGRSFLQLASIQPGVTISPGTTSQYNQLFAVSILGGATSQTAITVDGGSTRNAIEGGSQMNFSQEVVKEFQLSSANFDLSTGITSVGAINMVTRSGGNDFHGSGYFFFRDHNMSAYPGLKRDPLTPDPFFARRNPGFSFSGPLKKDRLFFFFNYEYMNQTQAVTVQPDLPSVAGLAGSFSNPYAGKTLSFRLDYQITLKHLLFARYSHDGNHGFGPNLGNGGASLPSDWLRNQNWADQSVLGLTSVLTSTVVNDFRFNYAYWQNRNLFPTAADCPNCVGFDLPEVSMVGSNNFYAGHTKNATQGRDLRRFDLRDDITWQKGTHRLRFGADLDREPGTGFWGYCDPACTSVFSPEYLRGLGLPAALNVLFGYNNLPSTITSTADLLKLPLAGGVIGVGDPSQPPPYNLEQAKKNNRYHLYAQDSWRLRPNFTLNYGLGWQFESTLVNRDLTKPAYLAPIYGSDLNATHNNYHNFEPALGFAWNVGKDNKTVVRGGAGIYYDTESLYRRLQERSLIGPVGNGRIQFQSSGLKNIFPGIFYLSGQGVPTPVAIGDPLPYSQLTNLTLGQFLQIYNQQFPALQAALAPKNLNDLSIRNIQLAKGGAQLYPLRYPTQRSYQMSIGVQRELTNSLVVTADFVRRVFVNTLIGELDQNRYNRFINGARSPVIPVCTGNQAADPTAECSIGQITFWTPGGRGVYDGLLLRADKRFSKRFQFTASYALQALNAINSPLYNSQLTSSNTVFNLDNYNESKGPQGPRHVLSVSGVVNLPLGFELGLISYSQSRNPINAVVPGIDLSGSGIANTPIPGIPFNQLTRGYGKADLAKAVGNWNSTYAGKKDARGNPLPQLVLPGSYDLGDPTNTEDLRLSKRFTFKERYRLSVFAEMFNILNVANLSGYSYYLDSAAPPGRPQTFSFGQPTQRITQVFGSGGPRAVQLGARFSF